MPWNDWEFSPEEKKEEEKSKRPHERERDVQTRGNLTERGRMKVCGSKRYGEPDEEEQARLQMTGRCGKTTMGQAARTSGAVLRISVWPVEHFLQFTEQESEQTTWPFACAVRLPASAKYEMLPSER